MPEEKNQEQLDKLLDELKDEMGVSTKQEVVETIIRLAVQRANVVCPKCGHQANCTTCMSPEHIAEEIMTNLEKPQ
jgi:hypothetical protein